MGFALRYSIGLQYFRTKLGRSRSQLQDTEDTRKTSSYKLTSMARIDSSTANHWPAMFCC